MSNSRIAMTRDTYAKARVFQPQLCKLVGRYGVVYKDSEMSYIVSVLSDRSIYLS